MSAQVEQQAPAPMDDDAFDEAQWEAAKAGATEDPPGQEETPAEAQAPDATPVPPPGDSPAVETPPPSSPPETPQFSAEQIAEFQRKARQFDSVQGNWQQAEQRWMQERVSPLQERLDQLERENRQYQEYLISLQPQEQQQRLRAELAQQEQQRTQAAQAAQAQQALQIQQAQVQQQAAQLSAAEKEMARVVALTTMPAFMDQLAQQYGLPKDELALFDQQNQFTERLRTLPPEQIGAQIQALEAYAATRGAAVARENAARAAQAGTYRAEGNQGSAGQDRASNIAKMNQADFEAFWERAKSGRV